MDLGRSLQPLPIFYNKFDESANRTYAGYIGSWGRDSVFPL